MPLRPAMFILALVLVLTTPFLQAKAQDDNNETATSIWIERNLPPAFDEMLAPLFAQEGYIQTSNRDSADLQVLVTTEEGAISSQWLYVPVVPFASTAESISFVDIQRYWNGQADALSTLAENGRPLELLVTDSTLGAIQYFLGEPALNTPIRRVPGDAITSELWAARPNAWSLVPFDELQPDMKALTLDNQKIFAPDFDNQSYPLKMNVSIQGDEERVGQTLDALLTAGTWRGSNRNEASLSRIVLSGVTALTRATANQMELYGLTRPGEGILPFVESADIFHTSNEVSFSQNCPPPDPYGGVVFCSDARYMELLEYIGLDVVELTGNHVNDYGPGALRYTLDIYDEAGLQYYGGGRNFEEARQALILEHDGNSIAFIGCNLPGPFRAWASDESAGAAQCDDVYLEQTLGELSQQVDVVIMSMQDYEFYRYDPPDALEERMNRFIEWGADVVIGSQAHQPHGFNFVARPGENAGFVHFGMGNLFFDQMAAIATRQLFMDRLIIYEGRVISVELFTGIIDDFCCPRPMTETERIDFLNIIFEASGW